MNWICGQRVNWQMELNKYLNLYRLYTLIINKNINSLKSKFRIILNDCKKMINQSLRLEIILIKKIIFNNFFKIRNCLRSKFKILEKNQN